MSNLQYIVEDPGDEPGCSDYRGPERRRAWASLPGWVAAMLDEIDYGMLLLVRGGRVLHLNHAASIELDGEHPLQVLGGYLRASRSQDAATLHDALQAATQRHVRKLLTLGSGAQRVNLAVVPLATLQAAAQPATLVTLAKRQLCAPLSVHGFARSHGLTPAETEVLQALAEGAGPSEIAARQGVELSTVRTQISSMRAKTGADSIRTLERQVARLPPLIGALRQAVVRPFAAGIRALQA